MTAARLRRPAALFEVLGVYSGGPLVGYLLRKCLGITVINPLTTLRADITDAALVQASINMFVLLLFQYAGSFLVIVPLNWWNRRSGPAAYGLTRRNRAWPALLLAGLATAALADWPAATLAVINYVHPSEMAPWRQAIIDTSWLRWQFWLFAGVLSWALVPIAEELLYRGYCQRRLAEDWGNGPAIAATSCLFAFAHTQYQIPNAYNIGMILSILVMAIGYGVVFAWTGSILPSVIAHAIINLPMTLPWQIASLILLLIGVSIAGRFGIRAFVQTFYRADWRICIALGILLGAWSAVTARLELAAVILAATFAMTAIALEAFDKHRSKPTAHAAGPSQQNS